MRCPELSQFSAKYQVQYPQLYKSAESQAFLRDLLSRIAQVCKSKGAAVIGHIKLLATLPEGGYFHGSVTSTRTPPTFEAFNVFPHQLLEIALVVLVYGIAEEEIERIVDDVWNEIADDSAEIIVHHQTDPPLSKQKDER
jgi:hypothetical protein